MTTMTAIALPDDGSLSLAIPEGATFEDWQDVGRRLFARSKVVNWWIGDWWVFGEHRYGDRAKAAAEGLFGREFQTLMNLGSVAKAFETSRRREVVPFTAYAEVASLPAQDADALIERAAAEGLATRAVRQLARLRRIDLGMAPVADRNDDDEATAVMKKVQFAWNGASIATRQYIFEALEEVAGDNFRDIDL